MHSSFASDNPATFLNEIFGFFPPNSTFFANDFEGLNKLVMGPRRPGGGERGGEGKGRGGGGWGGKREGGMIVTTKMRRR